MMAAASWAPGAPDSCPSSNQSSPQAFYTVRGRKFTYLTGMQSEEYLSACRRAAVHSSAPRDMPQTTEMQFLSSVLPKPRRNNRRGSLKPAAGRINFHLPLATGPHRGYYQEFVASLIEICFCSHLDPLETVPSFIFWWIEEVNT